MMRVVQALRAANLALKFMLELSTVAAFAIWGASTDGGVRAVLLAVITPSLAIALWARFAAPSSPRRLPVRARIPFELTVFALAALALIASGHEQLALVFAVTAAINAILLMQLDQWER
jgi:Protein of unknown function (DUF2568)